MDMLFIEKFQGLWTSNRIIMPCTPIDIRNIFYTVSSKIQ